MVRIDIDNPEFRRQLAEDTRIHLVGSIPESVFKEGVVVLGNYIGLEKGADGSPDLTPTMEGLLYFSFVVSQGSEKNRLIAVAREGALFGLDENLAKTLGRALINAKKTKDGYQVGFLDSLKMTRHVKREGVLWMSPAATTDKDGMLFDLRTGGVLLAESTGSRLGVLAMEAPDAVPRKVTALHYAEIPLPLIRCDRSYSRRKELTRMANFAIAQWSMATAASLLPENYQKGEYIEPEIVKERAVFLLRGLATEGLIASGGFMQGA